MSLIIAHRGASSETPENTLTAIKRAIDLAVDFIEIDVHLTQDHIPVLIHDSHITRTTNSTKTLNVEDLSLHALKTFDAGSWFHSDFSGETIPSLDEVLALPRGNTGLMIELKRGNADPAKLVAAVIASVNRASAKDSVIIGSFSVEILHEVHKQGPDFATIGNVQDTHLMPTFHDMHLRHVAVWYKLVNPTLIREFHGRGTKVWTFTVDDPRLARFLLSINVDGIITNDPRNLLRLR